MRRIPSVLQPPSLSSSPPGVFPGTSPEASPGTVSRLAVTTSLRSVSLSTVPGAPSASPTSSSFSSSSAASSPSSSPPAIGAVSTGLPSRNSTPPARAGRGRGGARARARVRARRGGRGGDAIKGPAKKSVRLLDDDDEGESSDGENAKGREGQPGGNGSGDGSSDGSCADGETTSGGAVVIEIADEAAGQTAGPDRFATCEFAIQRPFSWNVRSAATRLALHLHQRRCCRFRLCQRRHSLFRRPSLLSRTTELGCTFGQSASLSVLYSSSMR